MSTRSNCELGCTVPTPNARAQWQACVMREARFEDVWSYLTLAKTR